LNWRTTNYLLALLILTIPGIGNATPANANNVAPPASLSLGVKIWQNECAGKFQGMISWNESENFASLGIGHFVWRPYSDALANSPYSDDFPLLIKYIRAHGVEMPSWLKSKTMQFCPWRTREDFIHSQHSPMMNELRHFLLNTITIQADYMLYKLKMVLPRLLSNVTPEERPYICKQFYTLASTPKGLYALADYLNFKGSGATLSGHYDPHGWGLLQVLETMHKAPPGMTPLQAYVWAAESVMIRRTAEAPPALHAHQWLAGWLNRIQSYK
jgi:hypothetical protein